MTLDRRAFLAGTGLFLLPSPVRAPRRRDVFAAVCREPSGAFAAVVCDAERGIVSRVTLPARGHDIATRPGTRECVVFARRPGRFAVVFDAGGDRPPTSFDSTPGRHFFGHGVFSPDGRLLFSTEDDIASGQGVIGIRDATGGYRHIGEFASGGIGPHDIALLADGRTLVVANGGIETGGGREALNPQAIEASLDYIDLTSGDLLEHHVLAPDLRRLSIRHLAAAKDGTLVFGCQVEGDGGDGAPLIGFHRRDGEPRLMEAPASLHRLLRGYVGSVAADRSGDYVVATSPRGGVALVIDVAHRRAIGECHLDDVCGVAPRHGGDGFLLTSGFGDVARLSVAGGALERGRREDLAWDNHAADLALG